ncbi:hypothetical protein ACVWZV_005718 [Bradyrhizobium sp. GM5.1]
MKGKDQPGIMDRQRGVGGDLARCRSEKQVAAGRVAHRMVSGEFGFHLAAGIFYFQARGVHLRARGARRRDGPANPTDRLAAAQQPPDDIGLLHVSAR